jgi:hypothetical protein
MVVAAEFKLGSNGIYIENMTLGLLNWCMHWQLYNAQTIKTLSDQKMFHV